MFNSPALDVAISLVFIFLLYSLLATSIKEAIATFLGLRARMLKTGIIDGMLSDTPTRKWWESFGVWIKENFLDIFNIIRSKREKDEDKKKIGDKFYEHPIIRNYGSSRLFPYSSYIPAANFSTVLVDVLKKEFEKRLPEIAAYKRSLSSYMDISGETLEQSLLYSTDMVKCKELIEYYGRCYAANRKPSMSVIDKDTWHILNLHLRNSSFDLEKFKKNLESWFDDSMDRVSGWYKRQTQVILFVIGLSLAVIFNVDTIEITGKLSNDKDARDKLVLMAEKATDQYKDDPRVKKIADRNGNIVPDTSKAGSDSNTVIFKQYQTKADSIRQFIKTDVEKANNVIAIGWGDFGKKRDSARIMTAYFNGEGCYRSKEKRTPSTPARHQAILDSLYEAHWVRYKVGYVLQQSTSGRRPLGYLLTALAICLGAPFWFDLLGKLIKLRAAGKKQDSSNNDTAATKTPAQQPVTLNVNTQPGEEAVG